MELYRKVRLARREGMSERAAALYFGISRASVKKMMSFSKQLKKKLLEQAKLVHLYCKDVYESAMLEPLDC